MIVEKRLSGKGLLSLYWFLSSVSYITFLTFLSKHNMKLINIDPFKSEQNIQLIDIHSKITQQNTAKL